MMDQLEYVIEELERALRVWLQAQTDRNLMLVQPDVVEDALAILKALAASRQARVIRKDELGSLPQNCVVWQEDNWGKGYGWESAVAPMGFERISSANVYGEPKQCVIYVDGYNCLDEYGKSFRFWSARPTDEQREAEKWEG